MKHLRPGKATKALVRLMLGGVMLAAFPALAEKAPPLTVVELFTSQGCDSCPPADHNLLRLSTDPGILALSWFVDYWNYLGWTDTFGRAENTARQRRYNGKLGLAGVFTPQIIIDGVAQEVGSHIREIDAQIALQQKKMRPFVPIAATLAGPGIDISLASRPLPRPATLWAIGFKAKADVAIRGGELKGMTAHYANVVTSLRKLGEWAGKPQSFRLAVKEMKAAGADHFALLLQDDGVGEIIGAAAGPLDRPEE